LGCEVRRLPPLPDCHDAVFVEDTAVVFDELAVIARPGAASRRPEIASVVETLRPLRPLQRLEAPATLDGGDVLCSGRRVWVGLSRRTNAAGAARLRDLLEPHGYTVSEVAVERCLHLKSAVSRVGDRTLLIQPAWVEAGPFADHAIVEADPREPAAANALCVGDAVVYPDAYPKTRDRLERAGVRVMPLGLSELIKAEGGVTCCSLIFGASMLGG